MEQQPYVNPLLENSQIASMMGDATNSVNQAQQQRYVIEEREKSLAQEQLECEQTLNKLYHKLKQDVLTPIPDGRIEWLPCPPDKRILTDEGVNKLMQVIESYVNKETLLSNFDAKQIQTRMLQFCKAINSLIFMKYEMYFRLPSIDECELILEAQIQDKINTRLMGLRLMGEPMDEVAVRKDILQQYGSSFEDEITTIRNLKLRENIREYEIIFTQIVHIVEAIHNRAFRGEERGSIRRHQNITEVIGSNSNNNQPIKKANWYNWS